MSSPKKLSQLKRNQASVVRRVDCEEPMRSRLTAMGLYPGAQICALFESIGGGSVAYLVQGSLIALRQADAEKIFIE